MENIIEMKNIYMSFNTNKVLNDVNFTLRKGEVNSLIGANGAGKSTLIKILNGIHIPVSGEIYIRGELVNIKSPKDIGKYGISFVHQELNLCQDMTIAENIFIGNWRKNKFGLYDKTKTEQDAKKLLESMGIDLDPGRNIRDLRAAEQQIVEILKALTHEASVIVLDEPTSSLNEAEKEKFFSIVEKMKSENISIIFITHFLEDVLEISDRVTVIKDGVNNGVFDVSECTKDQLIESMIGTEVAMFQKSDNRKQGSTPALTVKNLTCENSFQDISFEIYPGEIVGVCGLLGAGKTEIARSIYGLNEYSSGDVLLNGTSIKSNKPKKNLDSGIAFLSENRKNDGFVPLLSINENITMSNKREFANKLGVIDKKSMRKFSQSYSEKLSVKMQNIDQNVVSLSGGNQQKVIIARCLAINPKVFLLDEPTRGVDINAKNEIYNTLQTSAIEGTSILMFSSEIDELLNNCNRIVVLKQGEIVDIVNTNEVSKNKLLSMIS